MLCQLSFVRGWSQHLKISRYRVQLPWNHTVSTNSSPSINPLAHIGPNVRPSLSLHLFVYALRNVFADNKLSCRVGWMQKMRVMSPWLMAKAIRATKASLSPYHLASFHFRQNYWTLIICRFAVWSLNNLSYGYATWSTFCNDLPMRRCEHLPFTRASRILCVPSQWRGLLFAHLLSPFSL